MEHSEHMWKSQFCII